MTRSIVLGVALALAGLASAATATAVPSAPPLDAVEVLRRAENAAWANPDPQFIVYDMHEIFVHHGKQFTYDYHVWYRADGKGLMQNAAADRYGRHEQLFGYPFPSAPDANFLVYATPPPASTPQPLVLPSPGASGGASPPPLISIVPLTASRYYRVSMVGVEDYQGHTVYHLNLERLPEVDVQTHPWTEIWVDAQTFEVWKAHAKASGSKGPASGAVEAVVEFEPVGQYWLISQATGDGEVHFGFISDSGHYEYYFSGYDFPNTLPDWYFDPDKFRHRRS